MYIGEGGKRKFVDKRKKKKGTTPAIWGWVSKALKSEKRTQQFGELKTSPEG